MFKKILLTISFVLILLVPLASRASDDNLYRNDEYHFRIKFPAVWEVKNGDGEHVVKKAVKDDSTVLVLVRNLYDSLSEKEKIELSESDKKDFQTLEMSAYSEKEAMEFLSEMANSQLEAFPGSKILEKEMRYIDNRKAVYLKINQVYKVQNLTVEGISIYYSTIHKGKLYQIQGFYPKGDEYQEPTIKESLATFVFEDWNEPLSITGTNDASKDTKATSTVSSENKAGAFALVFVTSLLFTWGLGLLAPFLLRFVFLKRPLSKWASIVTAGFIWIVQSLIATAVSGKSTGHQALILVALVSYWILRSGVVKNVIDPKENQPVKDGETNASMPVQLPSSLEATQADKEQVIIPTAIYCSKCGHIMKISSTFCSQCGEKHEALN